MRDGPALEGVPMTTPLEQYVRLLDELLWRRAVEKLDEEDEERFSVTLNDYRRAMAPEDEARIAEIVAERRATAARPSLNLVDTEPPELEDGPLRRTAA